MGFPKKSWKMPTYLWYFAIKFWDKVKIAIWWRVGPWWVWQPTFWFVIYSCMYVNQLFNLMKLMNSIVFSTWIIWSSCLAYFHTSQHASEYQQIWYSEICWVWLSDMLSNAKCGLLIFWARLSMACWYSRIS